MIFWLFSDFFQPQHIWPYLQHNFIHHHSQLHNQGFHANNNHQHPHVVSPIRNNNSESDNQSIIGNVSNHNNNNSSNHNNNNGTSVDGGGTFGASGIQETNERLQSRGDKQIIAKPLASRPPPPFLHHTLNHPHLHSLLAHCRNPYIGAGNFHISIVWCGIWQLNFTV